MHPGVVVGNVISPQQRHEVEILSQVETKWVVALCLPSPAENWYGT